MEALRDGLIGRARRHCDGTAVGHRAGARTPGTGRETPEGLADQHVGGTGTRSVDGRGLFHDLVKVVHGAAGPGSWLGKAASPFGSRDPRQKPVVEILEGKHGASRVRRRGGGIQIAREGHGCKHSQHQNNQRCCEALFHFVHGILLTCFIDCPCGQQHSGGAW